MGPSEASPIPEWRAAAAESAVVAFLKAIGAPMTDAEMARTAGRVAHLWQGELLRGYRIVPSEVLVGAEPAQSHDLVVVRDLSFTSTCPHHLLPYQGRATLAYVPGERVAGFGALARLVDCFANRLDLQETVGANVADAIMRELGAQGAACVIVARQMCLCARGERQMSSTVVTEAFRGLLADRPEMRASIQVTVAP
jgi:GTP cyclohydrolase IA